jgi:hypothetical protein
VGVLTNPFGQRHWGIPAVSRIERGSCPPERHDAFAVRSHGQAARVRETVASARDKHTGEDSSIRTLAKLDPAIDPSGGAVALVPPVFGTGAVITTTSSEMERRDLELRQATVCIGGGKRIAPLLGRT